MEKNKLLFIGPPGCGKGTQAKFLESKGYFHLSTGEIIRKAFKEKNKLLLAYQERIDSGEFLSDELIFELVSENLKGKKQYILDGAVRTKNQAEYFLNKKMIDIVFFFNLNNQTAMERILKRKEKRKDDNIETIKKRFEIYEQETIPAIKFLKEKIKVIEIDASQNIEEIRKQVFDFLGIKK